MSEDASSQNQDGSKSWVPWLILVILTLVASLAVFLPAGSMPWPECQIHKHSGMYCPGCGGTRAARSIAAGDLLLAMKQNIMVFPILIGSAWVAIAFVVNRLTGRNWWSPARIGWRTMWVLLAVLAVFTILRNLEIGAFLRP